MINQADYLQQKKLPVYLYHYIKEIDNFINVSFRYFIFYAFLTKHLQLYNRRTNWILYHVEPMFVYSTISCTIRRMFSVDNCKQYVRSFTMDIVEAPCNEYYCSAWLFGILRFKSVVAILFNSVIKSSGLWEVVRNPDVKGCLLW